MKEFRHIWDSYMDGEPKSKVIKESHHIEDEDDEVTGEEAVLEHLQHAMDAQIKISGGFDRAAKELIELLQENLEEEDKVEPEEWDAAEEEDKEGSEDPDYKAQKMATAEAKDKAKEVTEESDDPEEEDDDQIDSDIKSGKRDPDGNLTDTRDDAEDNPGEGWVKEKKPAKVNESLILVKEENIRLKEDLSLLVHRLKRHGLLDD